MRAHRVAHFQGIAGQQGGDDRAVLAAAAGGSIVRTEEGQEGRRPIHHRAEHADDQRVSGMLRKPHVQSAAKHERRIRVITGDGLPLLLVLIAKGIELAAREASGDRESDAALQNPPRPIDDARIGQPRINRARAAIWHEFQFSLMAQAVKDSPHTVTRNAEKLRELALAELRARLHDAGGKHARQDGVYVCVIHGGACVSDPVQT